MLLITSRDPAVMPDFYVANTIGDSREGFQGLFRWRGKSGHGSKRRKAKAGEERTSVHGGLREKMASARNQQFDADKNALDRDRLRQLDIAFPAVDDCFIPLLQRQQRGKGSRTDDDRRRRLIDSFDQLFRPNSADRGRHIVDVGLRPRGARRGGVAPDGDCSAGVGEGGIKIGNQVGGGRHHATATLMY
ncbi:hypothetical protein MES4922_210157 [Mesorhizobium ventifaucium]|uniref:Uncharacterized protein n=1 Tax=Mesorhizobium ventifaucium TaxID=666020 RepID=A0ABN8JPI2_9HYPH|nr:hypothetical protein MES4922_210157 [Mesorhizobium ventifaucium]